MGGGGDEAASKRWEALPAHPVPPFLPPSDLKEDDLLVFLLPMVGAFRMQNAKRKKAKKKRDAHNPINVFATEM